MPSRTAIVVDRSMLAANMFRLLLAPLGIRVINALSLEEMRDALRSLREVDLMVISSNVFADKLERAVEFLAHGERLEDMIKIVLLREGEIEKGWDQHVAVIPHAIVIGKPFHPDEFILRVRRLLAFEE